MWNKTDFKINGEHKALGNELSIAEFKGYTVSELESIKNLIKELKQDYLRESSEFRNACVIHRQQILEKIGENEKEIRSLSYFRAQILALSSALSIVAGAVVSFFLGK